MGSAGLHRLKLEHAGTRTTAQTVGTQQHPHTSPSVYSDQRRGPERGNPRGRPCKFCTRLVCKTRSEESDQVPVRDMGDRATTNVQMENPADTERTERDGVHVLSRTLPGHPGGRWGRRWVPREGLGLGCTGVRVCAERVGSVVMFDARQGTASHHDDDLWVAMPHADL